MKVKKIILSLSLLFFVFGFASPAAAQEELAVVRGVLFYSPTCPHCHTIINEVLPPLIEQYDEQLLILGVDVTVPEGQALYQAAIETYAIPEERFGVPTLIVGDVVMVGSLEIPEQLPLLIEEGLARGGFPWPDLPGIPPPGLEGADTPTEAVEAPPTEAVSAAEEPQLAPVAPAIDTVDESPVAELDTLPTTLAESDAAGDGEGFMLGLGVLILLFAVISYATVRMRDAWEMLKCTVRMKYHIRQKTQWWGVPVLTLIGIGISGYMAYIETQHLQAVCGPVGNCNLVQQSQYAYIGPVPVAFLGILGFALIALLWFMQQGENPRVINYATLGLLILPIGAVLFSIYLTYIELFVIHAVCMWCLSSAAVSAGIMFLVSNEVVAEAEALDEKICTEADLAAE